MTKRHLVLAIGALIMLGLGVYLLVAVRAEPTASRAATPSVRGGSPAEPAEPAMPAEPAREPTALPAAAPPRSSDRPARALPTNAPPHAAVSEAVTPIDPSADAKPEPKLDSVMAEANKAYDRGDLEDAKSIAARMLAREPTNVRMLRIMVSASCIDGDTAAAQVAYLKLPVADRAQMRTRCSRYGIALSDTP